MDDRQMTDMEFFDFLEVLYEQGDFETKKEDTPEITHLLNSMIDYMNGNLTRSANRIPC